MKKAIIGLLIAIPVMVLAGAFGYIFYYGPRMKAQPHVRAFQMVPPPMPAGTKTVEATAALPPESAAAIRNPVPLDPSVLTEGKVYYRYYCVFCHGEEGAGNGPVGESYEPAPADLRSRTIQAYSDAELLRAMLTGTGHEPVLERTVPPRHRWQLVHFVRSFSAGGNRTSR